MVFVRFLFYVLSLSYDFQPFYVDVPVDEYGMPMDPMPSMDVNEKVDYKGFFIDKFYY